MKTVNNFEFKQRKYIPVFPKADGKPTVYRASVASGSGGIGGRRSRTPTRSRSRVRKTPIATC